MLKKEECVRKISIAYLIVLCIYKVCEITVFFKNINLNTIMFAAGCVILVLIFITKKRKIKYPIILYIFIFIMIINVIFNFDVITIKNALFGLFYIFIIYNIANAYLEEIDYQKIIKIILSMSYIIITIFFISYIIMSVKSGIPTKNMIKQLIFININSGALLALINIIMINYMYKAKRIRLSTTIYINIYYTIFIIISQARTTLLALILIIAYWCYCNFFNDKKYIRVKKILEVLILMCIVFITIFFAIIIIEENYNEEYEINSTIKNIENNVAKFTTNRYWLWKYSVKELMNNNILFGLEANFGEECFKNIDDIQLLTTLSTAEKKILAGDNVHNGYIQILIRNGILGFSTIMMFFITFGKKMFGKDRNEPYYRYVKYFYLFYIVTNLFENNIILSNSLFVLLLWINVGMDTRMLNEKVNLEKEMEEK